MTGYEAIWLIVAMLAALAALVTQRLWIFIISAVLVIMACTSCMVRLA